MSNNSAILNKLIKSRGKCKPKSKTFSKIKTKTKSFVFHLRNSKTGKKYVLQIWIWMQNMSAIYHINRLLQIGEKNPTGNLKSHLHVKNFTCSKVFEKSNFFTDTFKGFCRTIPELLLREVHLSVTLAWNLWLFFARL